MERLSAALIEALEARATIVTASARQAFAIQLAWGRSQQQQGHRSWPTPDVLPFDAWLTRSWREAYVRDATGNQPQLLSVAQERALWDAIVGASAADQDYLQPFGLARTALEAWRRMHAWAIPWPALRASSSAEARAFAAWARSFEARTRAANWIDAARALEQTPLPNWSPPTTAWCCVGFDRLTPAQQKLIGRLQGRAVDARVLDSPAVEAQTLKIGRSDPEAELRTAAQWARVRLLGNPQARLLIIIPDLQSRRAQAERIFSELLVPASLILESDSPPALHAVDGGVALAGYPLIAAALTALQAAAGTVPFETLSDLLRAPFLVTANSHLTLRARLDLRLREVAAAEVGFETLLHWLERWKDQPWADAQLLAAGREFMERLRGASRRPSEWSGAIASALKSLGWPGERSLDSAEFQTVEKFNALLAEFASCDSIYGSISLAEAARRLRRSAQQTAFQPESGERPVLLSSRLADPGLLYDGLWITGLHAAAWPQAPRPDPFIPWQLQRAAGIPEATPQGRLAAARMSTGRLLQSAAQVIVSWPARVDEETGGPSPLIASIDSVLPADLGIEPADDYRHRLQQPASIELLEDEWAPPFQAPARVPGGAGTLSLQSRCPFRAFAERRLAAPALRTPPAGIDPPARGLFVHRALELLWTELGSQAALQALPPSDLDLLLTRIVAQAAREKLEQPRRWPPQMLRLESNRLNDLLREFVVLELSRPAFRVRALEQRGTALLQGFELQLRLDRVDELQNGAQLLIDYKTGAAKIGGWSGERLSEPQLPLYAALGTPPPAAVAFAILSADGCAYSGLSAGIETAAGIKPVADWEAQLQGWRVQISQLMTGFAAGDARVDPINSAECRSCHLQALCRIDERRRAGATEVDDAD